MNRRQFLTFASVCSVGITGYVGNLIENDPSSSDSVSESGGNVANPVIALTGMPAETGMKYNVMASVSTNGADSLVITHNEEDIAVLNDGKGQVIASTTSSTSDPLPEGSLLVIHGVWNSQRYDIFHWNVQDEEVSNLGSNPFDKTQEAN